MTSTTFQRNRLSRITIGTAFLLSIAPCGLAQSVVNSKYGQPDKFRLRESVLGRELFDFAFREYSRRWMFKRPNPADLFRTMEDASGVDLDWFWRGWFYTTDHVDIAVTGVRQFHVDSGDPKQTSRRRRAEREAEPQTLAQQRNADLTRRVDT